MNARQKVRKGMTNKEIITQLEDIKCHCQEMYEAEIKNVDTSSSIWGKDVEALDFAIKALEQQSCEDCISRKEVIRIAEQGQIQGYEWQFKKLCTLPSVHPTPKTGHWIDAGSGQECSECGEIQYGYDNFRCFCANCGAKMEEEKDDNTRESNRTT